MSEDCPTVEVLALLDDSYARDILTATSERPMSAKTLSEQCGASLPTIYRRAERLVDCGLLEERTELAEDGHHYSIYEARLRRLSVELEDGELHVNLEEEREPDVADRFTDMWEGV
ncbi:winged helix-turn-helix domain-containing protein [Haloferax sulfurifontis]|uniref:ArsR family transcriptional regulator n=1 Tax=Haloferax sulfurifontis ATCC BAA-897 TaxID=662480 RepID=M0IIU2_9EURY|nr:winged helix-turn-helix domain-containing protein [Haloferax sulfurifontis]ELZ96675.1 ArsR family transcriptional regulator [Haloferax sulfurifontis ATCC BAA-897]